MFKKKKREYVYCFTFAILVDKDYLMFERFITLNSKRISLKDYQLIIESVTKQEELLNLVIVNVLNLGKK